MPYDDLANANRRQIAAQVGMVSANRRGIVTSFNPNDWTAKCTVQPDGYDSGWIPVLTSWVGAGWGFAAPLNEGDQVLLASEDGSSENLVVVGRYFSDVDPPPTGSGTGSGEIMLRHSSGSMVTMLSNGTINLTAATVNIYGKAVISGDAVISGISFDNHTHPDAQGGNTGVPNA